MDRQAFRRLVAKMDHAFCDLNDVRAELVEHFGDDCGLELICHPHAPPVVRKALRQVADRFDVVPSVHPDLARARGCFVELAAMGAD